MNQSVYSKSFRMALTASIVFLLLTAFFHSLSFISEPSPRNDQEKQLQEITTQYKADMGGGISRTYSQIVTALSSCFTLICILGGSLLWYYLRKGLDKAWMAGTLNIFLVIFGAMFLIMAWLTFWPPIICSACIFFGLLASRTLLAME